MRNLSTFSTVYLTAKFNPAVWESTQLNKALRTYGADTSYVRIYMFNLIKHCDFKTSPDRFPVPVKSAVKSYLTALCDQNLSNRALNALTELASTVEFGRLFQIFAIRAKMLA